MAKILDTTVASLVGGKFSGYRHFAGFLHFSQEYHHGTDNRGLSLYSRGCNYANETVVRYDLTSNVFMAKTKDILEVGGWSEELKIVEHKDLFLKLKATKKKVEE